jgi:Kef-type K+ transport system membrane component KefB
MIAVLGLYYTKAGAMVMAAAAINDAIAWCLLILAIALASAGNMANGGYTFLCVLAFAVGACATAQPTSLCTSGYNWFRVGAFCLLGPVFHRLVAAVEGWKSPKWDDNLFALTICLLFVCAWSTTLLGTSSMF